MHLSRSFFILIFLIFLVAACAPRYATRVIDTPENRELKGHQKPYIVNGKRYDPLKDHNGFVQEGIASWYGRDFHGKKTSNGEIYNMHAMTAAHKTLPLGVSVEVTNLANGKRAIVRVNDRGPFVNGRIIDLSFAAAKKLNVVGPGTAPVRVAALGFQSSRGDSETYRAPQSWDVGSFSIQVGAFTEIGNARRLADKLRRQYGYARVDDGWVNGRRFHRVRAGKFNSLIMAEDAMLEFARNGFPRSFVVAIE